VKPAEQPAGRHGFEWTPPEGVDPALGRSFRIVAASGSTALNATALMRDRVDAVSTSGTGFSLELARSGSVEYGAVKAFN